ncbi:protogenin A-like [Battus philenor]|uniref:protogenin A-like n=1 Tax=Battus philenor TaxID=42288 RepID=UPI0035CFB24A
MALLLLRVLVLGVTAAAVDADAAVRWAAPARAWLPCAPDARAPAARTKPYFWRRDGEPFASKKLLLNGTLEVSRKRDGGGDGVYQCGVRHHVGVVLGIPIHLKFAHMDKQFSSHPENVTVQRGQPATLACTISSGPPAAVSWLRNDELLPRDPRYYILDSQLLITDVTPEDAGTYKCIATNQLANRSRVSQGGALQVMGGAYALPPALLQLHQPANMAAPRGARLLLPCPLLGWPRPKLLWQLTPPGGRSSELESVDEVLELRSLELDQEGVYTCSVEGQPHLMKSFNVTLTEPVSITLPPKSKEVLRASTVRFNCTATGRPEPVISWYKDGQPLTLTGRINSRTSADGSREELVISGVTTDDAGVYQCFAHSGFGDVSSWATAWGALNVTGAWAAAPEALRCLPAGARRVALRWRPAAAKVVAYTVNTTPRDKSGGALTGQPNPNTEQVVTVEDALTPYFFQVRAFITTPSKKNVASDMSESVVCQGQGVPVKLSRVEGRVAVSWRQFAEETPGVVQWILQYKGDNETQEHNVTLAGHVTNYTLIAGPEASWVRVLGSRTEVWLPQDLSLLPWTAAATADQTPSTNTTAVPQDVTVSDVGLYGFTVKWACEEADSSPDKYSYRVCIKKVEGPEECQDSFKNSVSVEGLQPGGDYEVRVQAAVQGRAGGAFSEPVHVTTQPEGQARVGELSYSFVNATAVRVRWAGGAARYVLRHSSRLRLPVEQWAALATDDTSALITGIEPTEQTFVMVTGYEPLGYSRILTIPAQVKELEARELSYAYTRSGVRVWWAGAGARCVRFAQNITRPVEHWPSLNVSAPRVELENLDPTLPVYVMVTLPGPGKPNQVLTIPPRPPDTYNLHLSVGVGVGAGLLCLLSVAAACVWRRYKRTRSPVRTRRRTRTETDGTNEGSEMKTGPAGSGVGGRLANGACGEPLLNGHLRPHHPVKTPNGKVKRGRLYEAFDVSRDDADTTAETVLDDTLVCSLLDTSRRPDPHTPVSAHAPDQDNRQDSFRKLPDDNMNSELNRSAECRPPTLQPNG